MKIDEILPGVQKNILLKNYTTFKIGGRAKYFFLAKNEEDLTKAISAAKRMSLPFFILGSASNVLAADKGYQGLIIKIHTKFFMTVDLKKNKIISGAGTKLKNIVETATKNGLTGFEWAAGIPGTVGGAIFGNIGAFGKSISDFVERVRVLEIDDSKFKIKKLSKKDCCFKYKDSIFKHKKNLIIISVVFCLKKGEIPEIKKKIKEYLDYRKKHHPLNFPSAGCIFKNAKLKINNKKLLRDFPELKEFNKKGEIPAGWLVEKCGLKGKKSGNVKISEKHANFILNLGNGKAKDVKNLINLAKEKVKNKFGIELEEEIQHLS